MKLLPDGTIEIRNKKTGQTKIVQPNDLPSFGIPYSTYAEELEAAKKVGIETKTEIKKELSADEIKKSEAKANAERVIAQLENQYFGAQGTEGNLSYGRLGGILQKGAKALGKNPALRTYEATKESVRPTLARAAGDVGNLSLPEQQAAVKQLPGATSTLEEAIQGFNAIRQKFGLAPRQLSDIAGQSQATGLLPFLQQQAQQAQQQPGLTALESAAPALNIYNPMQGGYNPVAAGAAGEILLSLLTGKLTGKGISGIKGLVGGGSKAAVATERAAAATAGTQKGVTISGDTLIKAIEKEAKSATVTESKAINKFLEQAKGMWGGKNLNPEDTLTTLDRANTAFNKAGEMGKTAKATVEAAISRALREEFSAKLPEVMTAQNKLKNINQINAFLKKLIFPTAVGAGVGAGASLGAGELFRRLGIGQQ